MIRSFGEAAWRCSRKNINIDVRDVDSIYSQLVKALRNGIPLEMGQWYCFKRVLGVKKQLL